MTVDGAVDGRAAATSLVDVPSLVDGFAAAPVPAEGRARAVRARPRTASRMNQWKVFFRLRAHLKHLDVSHCNKRTDASIRAIAGGCTALKSLNVERCTNLTDVSIVAIAEHCSTALESLNVERCRRRTSRSWPLRSTARHSKAYT